MNGKLFAKFKNKENERTKIAQELYEAQTNLIKMKLTVVLWKHKKLLVN